MYHKHNLFLSNRYKCVKKLLYPLLQINCTKYINEYNNIKFKYITEYNLYQQRYLYQWLYFITNSIYIRVYLYSSIALCICIYALPCVFILFKKISK